MKVGSIDITPLHDGTWRFPPFGMFNKTEEQWLPHRQFLDADGLMDIELGAFLVHQGDRRILVDAGLGPSDDPTFGRLPESLAAVGFAPADITDVVLTHLHFDHIGWASDGETPTFPNATYRCDERDWHFFLGDDPYDESATLAMLGGISASDRLSPIRERLETWGSDTSIVPGLDVRAAPGHTPGSTIIVLSSGTERAMLLGDVVHCPAELVEDEWICIADVDQALAQRTREALARELEGSDIPVAGAHFKGMRFGRLLPGTGRRQWRVV
jgi:glyoxylase-like metal-dependent hydrolase (beta-lactamase superfamily II)